MGAGFHGGFGITSGYRFRIGKPVSLSNKTLDMALNPKLFAEIIAKKYNIHLKGSGQKIEIEFNPNLKNGIAGLVSKARPNIIQIGPNAFISEYELANTIAHELNHSRSYLKNGDAPEDPAYYSGNKLEEYMRGKK